jgi:hypothetical protein
MLYSIVRNRGATAFNSKPCLKKDIGANQYNGLMDRSIVGPKGMKIGL